jgi:hypothetical protein
MKINYLWLLGALPFLGTQCPPKKNLSYGLIFDDAAYAKHDKVPDVPAHGFGDDLPLQFSLKSYCPKPNDQGDVPSCVGQATGYGALTIMEAIRDQISTTNAITQRALSALFIYNQVKGSGCGAGTTFKEAFDKVLKLQGDVRIQDFEGKQQDCNLKPNQQQVQKAAAHRILSYQRLFDKDDRADVKVFKVKKSLAAHKPVVIGMGVTNAFKDYDGKTSFFKMPDAGGSGHAMVVIGYDDKEDCFEILNSWGENWGQKGFCKIKYADFAKHTANAYHLILPTQPSPTPNQNVALTGHFDFRAYNPATNQLTSTPVTFNGAYYETDRNDWTVGQRFQLMVNEIKKDKYLYVFSVDPQGKAQIHFPKRATFGGIYVGKTEGALVPYDQAAIVIPQPIDGQNNGLIKEAVGADWLCILYADQPVPDAELLQRVEQTSGTGNDFTQKLQKAFGNRLIPANQAGYESKQMRFKTNATHSNYIVPLVLKVEAR